MNVMKILIGEGVQSALMCYDRMSYEVDDDMANLVACVINEQDTSAAIGASLRLIGKCHNKKLVFDLLDKLDISPENLVAYFNEFSKLAAWNKMSEAYEKCMELLPSIMKIDGNVEKPLSRMVNFDGDRTMDAVSVFLNSERYAIKKRATIRLLELCHGSNVKFGRYMVSAMNKDDDVKKTVISEWSDIREGPSESGCLYWLIYIDEKLDEGCTELDEHEARMLAKLCLNSKVSTEYVRSNMGRVNINELLTNMELMAFNGHTVTNHVGIQAMLEIVSKLTSTEAWYRGMSLASFLGMPGTILSSYWNSKTDKEINSALWYLGMCEPRH